MPGPEFPQPSHSPEPKPVGEKEENREKREKRGSFELIPTDIPGYFLQVEPGVTPSLTRRDLKRLISLARQFVRLDLQIDTLKGKQEGPDKDIKLMAGNNPGLRGVVSKEENFVVTVSTRRTKKYNSDLLRQSLGEVPASTIVHDYLEATISIPPGFQTAEGSPLTQESLKTALTNALIGLSLKKEDVEKLITYETEPRVDGEALEKMVEEGKLTLVPGAVTISTTMEIKISEFKKTPQKISSKKES